MDLFLKRLARMRDWPTGTCAPLKGYQGCFELRWTAEKVEHRIFGRYESMCFLMLVGCTHKGKVYNPPGAFETLKERVGKLNRGEAAIHDYEIRSTYRDEE